MALHKKTFTLIEMLIVVVIIGILAAALIPRLQDSQARTRDMIRKKDIKTAADALTVYYIDNQSFPPANCINIGCVEKSTELENSWWILASLVPRYVSKPFSDPIWKLGSPYSYWYWGYPFTWDTAINCIKPSCNMTRQPSRLATLFYQAENHNRSNRFRACPDWTPWDSTPCAGNLSFEKRQNWMWIFDAEIFAVGDKK